MKKPTLLRWLVLGVALLGIGCVNTASQPKVAETRLSWDDVFEGVGPHTSREKPVADLFQVRIVDAVIKPGHVCVTAETESSAPVPVRLDMTWVGIAIQRAALKDQRGQRWSWAYSTHGQSRPTRDEDLVLLTPGACVKQTFWAGPFNEGRPIIESGRNELPRDMRRRAAQQLQYMVDFEVKVHRTDSRSGWSRAGVRGEEVVQVRLSDQLDLMGGTLGDDGPQ